MILLFARLNIHLKVKTDFTLSIKFYIKNQIQLHNAIDIHGNMLYNVYSVGGVWICLQMKDIQKF